MARREEPIELSRRGSFAEAGMNNVLGPLGVIARQLSSSCQGDRGLESASLQQGVCLSREFGCFRAAQCIPSAEIGAGISRKRFRRRCFAMIWSENN
jgi:hypothetical protein